MCTRKGVLQASVEDWILARHEWVQRKVKMGRGWGLVGSCLIFPGEVAGCKQVFSEAGCRLSTGQEEGLCHMHNRK